MSGFSPLSAIAEYAGLTRQEAVHFANTARKLVPGYLNSSDPVQGDFSICLPNQVLALDRLAETLKEFKRDTFDLSPEILEKVFHISFTPFINMDSIDARHKLDQLQNGGIPEFLSRITAQKENLGKILLEDANKAPHRILQAAGLSDVVDTSVIDVVPVALPGDPKKLPGDSFEPAPEGYKPPPRKNAAFSGFASRVDASRGVLGKYQDYVAENKGKSLVFATGAVAVGGTLALRGGRQLCNAFGITRPATERVHGRQEPTRAAKVWAAVQLAAGASLAGFGMFTFGTALRGR